MPPGQSVVFDFTSRGADKLAGDFRKTGDNAALAAKGARLCADAIEKQRKAASASVGATLALAKADATLEEAEHGLRDGALEAEHALKEEADAARKSGRAADESAAKHAAFGKSLKGLTLNPGLLGPALLLAPAVTSLAGVAAGAAAGLAGAFTAGGLALAGFGAVAKPVLTDAKKAAEAVTKAQDTYRAAIAAGVSPAKAFKAEQVAIAKAYAGMSPAQIQLSKQLGAMADAWDKVKTAETPVVAGALQPWLASITDLMGKLKPVIDTVAPVIKDLGDKFRALVNSDVATRFRDFVASFGAWSVSAAGSTLIDFFKAFMIILPQFAPLIGRATEGIGGLGPAVLKWAGSKATADHITAFMGWFKTNGPRVGELIRNLGGALKALAPGLTAGAALELKVISDFLGFVARLPPGLAKPLAEVAGAMLILKKTGVVSVGIKLTGLGAAASGAGAAAGPLAAAGAAIAGGIILEIRRDLAKGWHTAVADLPKLLEGVGGILNFSASGWANTILDHFSRPVRQMWDSLGHFLASRFDITRHQVSHLWDVLMNTLAKSTDIFKNTVGIAWDQIQVFFLRGVRYILGIMGKLPGPLGAPFRAAAKDIGGSMAGIQADVRRRTGQIQADINSIHGKNVTVKVFASGGGGMTFTQKVASAISSGGFSLHSLAGGGLVRMGSGPTADDVPAMLSRGELVVPANMVKAGAADNLRGRIPGFAGGGLAGMTPWVASAETGFTQAAESALLRAEFANLKKAVAAAAKAKAAAAAQPFGPLGDSGARSGSAALAQAFARSIMGQYHWGPEQWPPWLYLGNQESGWNAYAVNASSGAYGIGQSLGHGHPYNLGDYKTQVIWMANYIRGRYGNPAAAWGHERAFNWYAKGGRVQKFDQGGTLRPGVTMAVNNTGRDEQVIPGYASGGQVGAQGAAWLKAWRTRHGGGSGAAWGPVPVNQQIAAADRALAHAATLAHASLPAAQHRDYVNSAAWWRRHRDALTRERGGMRAWRDELGSSDRAITSWIAAAGTSKKLAPSVARWKNQRAVQEKEIAAVSAMLGPTAAQVAAEAKAHPAPAGPSPAQAAKEGAAWLKAWRTRHGGGFGAAWGPVVVNQQIAAMTAALHRARTLAGAPGLTAAQHKHWAADAAGDQKRLAVLNRELTVERAWRAQLGASGTQLAGYISAAGNTPSLRGNVTSWKTQLARQKATIGNISGMLGYSDAWLKAHPPAPVLPAVTHTYGGDVADNLGAVLAAALGPFTGGVLMDRGGTLRPGWNPPMYNGTGRPEQLVPARGGGGGDVIIQIESSGNAFDQFMLAWMKKHAKIKGGGSVQVAFGTR